MNTPSLSPLIPLRRRRSYTQQFKDECVSACMHPGVSIARVALGYGLNANLLRRWVADAEQADCAASLQSSPEDPEPGAKPKEVASFVPVRVEATAAKTAAADINIQINRLGTVVTVTWPSSAASECALWLREVLR